jgi:hypothetical protein
MTTEGEGTMTTYDKAVAKAAEIGREHGTNAAGEWAPEFLAQSPTDAESRAQCVLEDGVQEAIDPDMLPAPDLSGEWADGYTVQQLLWDTGIDLDPNEYDAGELADAYELAFSEAVEAEIVRVCQYQLAE